MFEAARYAADVEDAVDRVIAQWRQERPDLELGAMATIGRLGRLIAHLAPRVEAALLRHGLTTGEFDVLAALRRGGAPHQQTPSELSGTLMLSPAAMTNRLDRLEASGLVRRVPDPKDRRGVLVELTPKGLEAWLSTIHVQGGKERLITSVLDDAEREQLHRLLRRLTRATTSHC
jgi:DNA-binding MarR family transcriptional regulator